MDHKVIERKNIFLSTTLNNTGRFTKTINIDFVPDEVILKHVLYALDNTEEKGVKLYSTLVNDIMCSFVDSSSKSMNARFSLNRSIRGDFQFSVYNADDTLATDRNGSLFLHLEFVKYS